MTDVLDFDDLPTDEKIEIAWSAIEHNDDESQEILTEHARTAAEENVHHPVGEPSNDIECEVCCASIPLESEAAAVKRYTCEHQPEAQLTTTTEIICTDCSTKQERLVKPSRVSVVVNGRLQRRRTKPGDPSSAPYLFYLESVDEPTEFVQPGAQTAFGWGALDDSVSQN